jgi:agmatine deiminase
MQPSSRYRLPAEWEDQDAVLLAWPHQETDWRPILAEVEAVYLELVRQISRFENLLIIAPEAEQLETKLSAAGLDLSSVRLIAIDTDDTWVRDCGPVTVYAAGQALLLDFQFNGWGGKYPFSKDNRINRQLKGQAGLRSAGYLNCDLILEGGSIETDGQGTLLTTTTCLLNPNRNPQLTRADLEQQFSQMFGCPHQLWLDSGQLSGDDTDGHIDTLARLCPGDRILYVQCTDPQDEQYAGLKRMEAQLRQFRTRSGAPFALQPLPWPQPCYWQGKQLPANYANFLIINRAVLVPTYADPADAAALRTVQQAFPERTVIGIDCRALIKQHGSLHCISMQLPKGVCA